MNISTRILFFIALLASSLAYGQSYPLTSNSWDNPEFVDRFLGSLTPETTREPALTPEEGTAFEAVANLVRAGDYQAAIQALRTELSRPRGENVPQASAALNYTLAALLLQEGRQGEAVREFEIAIRKFPNFTRAYKNLGLTYIQQGRYDEAQPMLAKAVELGDGSGATYGLLAYCYLNMGRAPAALDAYRIASVLDPDNKDWKVGIAASLMQTNRYDEAVPKFRELLIDDPGNTRYYFSIANAFLAQNRAMEGAGYLEIIRRMGKADVDSMVLLGDIYVNENLSELAFQVYEEAFSGGRIPTVARALRFLSALLQRGALDRASDMVKLVEENLGGDMSERDQLRFLNLQSQLALAEGDDEAAANVLMRVIERDPLNGEALLLLGNYFASVDDYVQADLYYDRAIRVAEYRVDGLIQKARAKVAQRKFEEAVTLLVEAQSLEPRSHVARYLDAVRNAARAQR